MTEFNSKYKAPEFKLGINGMGIRSAPRDMSPFYTQTMPNKPIIVPKQPQPDIFFTPIEDNRELVLQNMKRELDNQLEMRRSILPQRY
jgi:hypothetical protein